MDIALFGATGGTGKCILKQALPEGDSHIRALVRSPGKLQIENSKLDTLKGNVLNQEDVFKTIDGTDGVLCTLGNTANNPSDLLTKATSHIISAMNRYNVNRLVVLTSMGLGSSRNQIPWVAKLLTRTFLSDLMADKRRQEQLIERSNLEWTIIRPGGLTDTLQTKDIYKGTDAEIMAGPISRTEVANFMLETVTSQKFLRKKPVITSKQSFDLPSMYSQFRQIVSRILTH
ncbi:MAG: NAD(P)-dependent oxidoreductase [Candidatus Halalkalibacterium sp. M3_1C_030]|jgi:putative NADH-flavin reductase